MPMVWNSEADAKLLPGILKIYDIKINKGPMLDELNAFMGPGCVGLAITNRITRLKKSAEAAGTGTNGDVTSTPKTPKSAKRKNGNATGNSSQDDEESPTKKRAGSNAAKSPVKREMSRSGDEGGDVDEPSDNNDVKQVASFFENAEE